MFGCGYSAPSSVETHGQKSYNGVALLSKYPLEDIRRGLPGDDSDEQARYIEAVASTDKGAVRVASIYLPNGNPVLDNPMESPKYTYKLDWMARLRLGIRIDHLLCSSQAIDRAEAINIHKMTREGVKPSDHVPVVGHFDL